MIQLTLRVCLWRATLWPFVASFQQAKGVAGSTPTLGSGRWWHDQRTRPISLRSVVLGDWQLKDQSAQYVIKNWLYYDDTVILLFFSWTWKFLKLLKRRSRFWLGLLHHLGKCRQQKCLRIWGVRCWIPINCVACPCSGETLEPRDGWKFAINSHYHESCVMMYFSQHLSLLSLASGCWSQSLAAAGGSYA